jgi:hypothetical protein
MVTLPPDPSAAILDQDDTSYLLAIPGMRESSLEGLNTPIDECDDEVEW